MAARYPGASSEGRTYTSLRDVCGPVGGFPAFSLRVSLCPTWRRKSPMAIYHLSAKPISRATGRSATGAAAYRAGVKIPTSALDRCLTTHVSAVSTTPRFWPRPTRPSGHTTGPNSGTPSRLPRSGRTPSFAARSRWRSRANFVERGMVADVVIHHAKGHNPHAHILLTMRGIGPDGFGQKHRDWNQKELLE